jgi:hypothetical protein
MTTTGVRRFAGGVRLPAVAVLLAVLATAVGGTVRSGRVARIPLYSEAVALDGAGGRTLVPPSIVPPWVGGTRAVAAAPARAQAAWLAAGEVPGAGGPYADLGRTALLDLHTLTVGGAPVAGWSPQWRYVWPRDASFVAAAYARTGHLADAREVLAYLQRVQAADGSFQARYLLDGSGPPDDRGLQEDGPGWALWALAEVTRLDPTAATDLAPLRDRSAARLAERAGLPPASSDYWERPERTLTLGIAAPTLAGLDAAAYLYDVARDPGRAATMRAAADRTARAVEAAFGPRYPRIPGGRAVDAAVTFLLPPFQRRTVPGAAEAARAAVPRLLRPAGGLAPGEGWRRDGVSWTPETALFALVNASAGDTAGARRWLDWLATHRTSQGAIPEKVLADGSPAAVAPLAWSAALVVLTLTEPN